MSEEKTMKIGSRAYRLCFEDDFAGESLDLTKWSLCPEQRRQDIGGRWADSEVSVHDGNLWLRARIREDGVPVSGGVRSLGKFEQTRGYFECRMMFPKTTGFWGAFWMMCGNVGKVDGSAVTGAELIQILHKINHVHIYPIYPKILEEIDHHNLFLYFHKFL